METFEGEATNQPNVLDDGKPVEVVNFSQIASLKRKKLDEVALTNPTKIPKDHTPRSLISSFENPLPEISKEFSFGSANQENLIKELSVSQGSVLENGNSLASNDGQNVESATESSRSAEDNDLSRSGSNFIFRAGTTSKIDAIGDSGLWNKKLVKKGYSKFIATMNNKKLANLYKKARGMNWTEEQINFSTDSKDFETFSPQEKQLLKLVLAFFARSDGLVNENLVMNFYQKITIPEARLFYGFQIYIEGIHAITYTLLIETFEPDKKERIKLLKNVDKYKSVAKKEAWIKKWIESGNPLAESLLAFVCVEGIFFSAAFCVIYWIKHHKKGLFKGLIMSNSMIARDERLHCEFGIELFKLLKDKLPQSRVYEIFESAIECEIEFAKEALPDPKNVVLKPNEEPPKPLVGMSADSMIEYIKFVADGWLIDLGYPTLYNVVNPFDWMSLIELPGRGNFFEVNNYQYTSGTKVQ